MPSQFDAPAARIRYAGQFFTTLADWPEVLRSTLQTNAERCEFLLASVWATFAVRNRIRELVFTRLLPGYREYARREAAFLVSHAASGRLARSRTAHALVSRIGAAGMHYLDLRNVPDVDETSYVDRVHMNEAGRAAFTRHLADSLAPLVR